MGKAPPRTKKKTESSGCRLSAGDAELKRMLTERIRAAGGQGLPEASWEAVLREMDAAARLPAGGLRVAILGPEGSFTHAAAQAYYGHAVRFLPHETVGNVFDAVRKRRSDSGVVPVENSTEGAVTHTMDELARTPLKVVGELLLPVSHHLMARGTKNTLRRVYSHPQVFGQCRTWLQRHLDGVEQVAVSSTSRAAELASKGRGAGALAGSLAASLYGLRILEHDVQDLAGNTTRFLVIGRKRPPPTGRDKTSLCFTVRHRAGALHDALGVFRRHDINLTRIESRPSKIRAWEYLFFVD